MKPVTANLAFDLWYAMKKESFKNIEMKAIYQLRSHRTNFSQVSPLVSLMKT